MNGVVFVLSLMLASVIIARVLPQPETGVVSTKLEAVTSVDAEYSLLYVGSSRVFRQFSPSTFDEVARGVGVATTSFNFGAEGMTAIEADRVVRELIDDLDDNVPAYFLVSPEVLTPIIDSSNAETPRVVEWHDAQGTVTAYRAIAASDADVSRKAGWFYNHTNSYLLRLTNLGSGLRAVGGLSPSDVVPPLLALGPQSDGFVSLDLEAAERPTPSLERGRSELQNGETRFTDSVQALAEQKRGPAEPATPLERRYLERLLRSVEDAGAELVIVIPPGAGTRDWLRWAGEAGVVPTVLDFNDPNRYPGLFEFDLWFDRGHLGEEGALIYTEMLAQRFTEQFGEAS